MSILSYGVRFLKEPELRRIFLSKGNYSVWQVNNSNKSVTYVVHGRRLHAQISSVACQTAAANEHSKEGRIVG